MQSHAAPAALLLAVILAGIIVAPYNKVEESFNTQAAHDILFHGTDLAQYDHFEHPGPVPRTFAGALYLSMLVKPLLWLADVVGIDAASMHITSLQLTATMLIDSYFWQKPFMFPELHVLLFNTVHDQSHLWGVSPFHAYFTTLLPNMVLWVLPCAAIAFVTQVRLRKILLVVTAFVALYSFLPHKEWRFIIYAVPIYNLATAVVLSQWVQNTKRSAWVPKLVVMALLLGSMLVTLGKTAVSAANYPGGLALSRLGDHLAQHHIRNVFVDDLTAQSGASRFLQTPGITYTQDERLAKEDRARFDFALIESGYVPNWQSHNFESIAAVAGFDGIDVPLLLDIVRWRKPVSLLPSAARISPRIHILQRNDL
ncbi:alpha-1,6- mannosyltransferase [Sorochytrium milnesiophthora]